MNNLFEPILADIEKRDTGLQKPHNKGIANLVSSILINQTPNLMVLGGTLNRKIKNEQD